MNWRKWCGDAIIVPVNHRDNWRKTFEPEGDQKIMKRRKREVTILMKILKNLFSGSRETGSDII